MEHLLIILKTKLRILRNYLAFELPRAVKVELCVIISVFTLFILSNYSQSVKYSIPKHGLESVFSELGLLTLFLMTINSFIFGSFFYRILLKSTECQLNTILPIKPKTKFYAYLIITYLKALFILIFSILMLIIFSLKAHLAFSSFFMLSLFIMSGYIFTSVSSAALLISSLNIFICRGKTQIRAVVFWSLNLAVLILLALHYSYFREAFSSVSGKSLRGLIFWLTSLLAFYIALRSWEDFSGVWSAWLLQKRRQQQLKSKGKLIFSNLLFGFLPAYVRPFIIRDIKLLFREFRSLIGLLIIVVFLLIAISKHTNNIQTLGSSIIIVCTLSFYVLSNSYFKIMEKGYEQLELMKSLPVSALRYWIARFVIAFIPMLGLTIIATISLIVFKGWDHAVVLQLLLVLLLIGLVISFIQTNFSLAIFPFTNYMLFSYNLYLIVIIITWPIFNLISLVLILGSFLLMKRALRNLHELEF